jgi:hypothetical protein
MRLATSGKLLNPPATFCGNVTDLMRQEKSWSQKQWNVIHPPYNVESFRGTMETKIIKPIARYLNRRDVTI